MRVEGAADYVECPPQVVGGRLRPKLGPEEIHHPLAVESVSLRHGEQLDEARSLPQAPSSIVVLPTETRKPPSIPILTASGSLAVVSEDLCSTSAGALRCRAIPISTEESCRRPCRYPPPGAKRPSIVPM